MAAEREIERDRLTPGLGLARRSRAERPAVNLAAPFGHSWPRAHARSARTSQTYDALSEIGTRNDPRAAGNRVPARLRVL